MGVEPPFIYEKPSAYNFEGPVGRGFNPRAATQASWTPRQPKPKQNGPLVNFNRHPDSYYQSPYGNINFVPMHPNTKARVKLAWKTQRIMRIIALLGALGAVFCMTTITKTSNVASWIIRVGPAIALCHTLYATYFLCRDINSRPPASCASYHMFAALLDAGLVPFLIISCYMATMDYTTNMYGWGTLFNDNLLDYKIIEAFMIISAIEGLLLLLSLTIDIYLAVTYRKLTHMPPDMNPLDDKQRDNLTGAERKKHKRNKSELVYDKHLSSSTFASERFSQMSQTNDDSRRIPFKHTRTDSVDRDNFSVRSDFLNEVRDPYGARASMQQDQNSTMVSRPSSAITPAANARPAGVGLEHKPARSSNLASGSSPTRPNSWLSYSDYEGMPAGMSDYANHELETQVRSMSPVSAISDHETHLVRHMPASHAVQTSPSRPATASLYHDIVTTPRQTYNQDQENDMPSPEELSLAPPPAYTPPRKRSREPLGMNPPTPVDQRFQDPSLMPRPLSTSISISSHTTPPRQALRETDANSAVYATPSSRPASFIGSGTKSRFYGNLRSSVGGSPTRNSYDDLEPESDDVYRSNTVKSDESGNFEVYGSDSDEDYDPYNHNSQHGAPVVIEIGESSPGRDLNGHRQVSNSTGFDLHAGYAGLDPEFGRGMARRREVSGKLAEEGRGYEITTPQMEVPSPLGQPQGRPGAAGWARFKGL